MKKYRYIILASVILIFTWITIYSWKTIVPYISDLDILINDLENVDKFKGTLIFMGLNIAQVIIAVIPAGPLEMAGAYIFKPLLGTLICDVAMTLGSLMVFLFVKKYGHQFIELFVNPKEITKLKFLRNKEKLKKILFIIFLIPGSPKDVITYGVGLSNLDIKTWALICFVGRLPSILLTMLSATMLGEKKYAMLIMLVILISISYIIGLKIYNKYNSSED